MEAGPQTLAQAEKKAIEQALKAAGGSAKRAAKILEISPSTMYSKIKSYGIKGNT